MSRIYQYIYLCLTLLSIPLSAQVSLIAPSVKADKGTESIATIKVSGFKAIGGMQFTFSWNPSVITYLGVTDLKLANVNTQNFGIQKIAEGKLTFFWESPNLTSGITLPDSAAIFSIKFKAIGEDKSASALEFIKTPTDIEISDISLKGLSYKVFNGTFTIGMMTAIEENSEELESYLPFPNPMQNETQIPFYLKHSDWVICVLYDLSGKKIYEKKEYYVSGKHFVTIDKNIINQSGLYMYRLQTANFFKVGKLLVL